ncbi:hypothetical protein [Methylosinus sp. R-45379]|uniref:hypothetical protein n=1 Tax=Methylosinus sp. R-45379 TaxID=980563 RepID=UPI0012EDEC89|nr:hypothetical protein [Methylosinus sp. R-45379]
MAQPKSDSRPDEAKCGSVEYRAIFIDRTQKMYGAIVAPIERVPPSEAEFLRREIEDSLWSENKGRFKIAQSNRFYHALQVQDAYERLCDKLAFAKKAESAKEATQLIFDAYDAAHQLTLALRDYLDFDERRNPPVVPTDKRVELYNELAFAPSLFHISFRCALSQWH